MKAIFAKIKSAAWIGLMTVAVAFLGACTTTETSSKSSDGKAVPEPETSKSVTQDTSRTVVDKTSEATAAKAKAGGGKGCD